MYNTPPTWSIYIAGLVFEWLLSHGGVAAQAQRSAARSGAVYALIDATAPFYRCPVARDARSRMNVVFRVGDGDVAVEEAFLVEAEARGLQSLRGHRSAGGVRASLYNAMSDEGVTALTDFMRDFAAERWGQDAKRVKRA